MYELSQLVLAHNISVVHSRNHNPVQQFDIKYNHKPGFYWSLICLFAVSIYIFVLLIKRFSH